VTISAGVASYPSAGATDGLVLLDRADAALYRAKRAGRNRVEIDQPQVDTPVRQQTD
jgi:PleD family two-component response regulator